MRGLQLIVPMCLAAASLLPTIRWIGETVSLDTLTRNVPVAFACRCCAAANTSYARSCAGVLCFTEYLTEWPCDTLTGTVRVRVDTGAFAYD
jgi:hypothetical protein